jgi:hypothetical protein
MSEVSLCFIGVAVFKCDYGPGSRAARPKADMHGVLADGMA